METVSIEEMLEAEPPRGCIPVILSKNATQETVRSISKYCGSDQGALLVALTPRGGECTLRSSAAVQVLRREATL